MQPTIEIFADQQAACAESPLWDIAEKRLLWVDNERVGIFARRENDETTTVISPDYLAIALALNDDGRLVIASSAGISLLDGDGDGKAYIVLGNTERDDYLFNDILASAAGELYAGSFLWGKNGMEHTSRLYHINSQGNIEVMDKGIPFSNGLGLSPDNNTLFFADTIASVIYSYNVKEGGSLSDRKLFAQINRDDVKNQT